MNPEVRFVQTWWLLALCGALDAVHAVLNLVMLDPDGSLGLRGFASSGSTWDMGVLALAAGACAILAGVWSAGRDNSWLLSLHGLALAGFGTIGVSPLVRSPLSFRSISLLFVVMAVSLSALAFRSALTTQRGSSRWFLNAAAAASIAFAFSFVAVGLAWVKFGPQAFWAWMISYFSFCAIFMLWISLRLRTRLTSQFGQREVVPRLQSPGHAH